MKWSKLGNANVNLSCLKPWIRDKSFASKTYQGQVLVHNSIDSQAVEELKTAFGLSGQSMNFVAIR